MSRHLRSWLLGLALVASWTAPLHAQDTQSDEGGQPAGHEEQPPAEPAKPGMPQSPDGPGGREGRRAGGAAGMFARLPEQLEFDEEQNARFADLMTQYRTSMQTWSGESGRDLREELKAVREEMRAAREAGNNDRVRELAEQMRDIADQRRAAMSAAAEQLDADLRGILKPEQLTKYEEIRTASMAQTGAVTAVEPNILRRALQSLELGEEQRGKVDGLFKQFHEMQREVGSDPAQRFAAVRKLNEDVRKELTKEQLVKLDDRLKLGRRPPRGAPRPGGAGEHGRPPGDEGPNGESDEGMKQPAEPATPEAPAQPEEQPAGAEEEGK